ncbi:MAG: hypothetical protein MI724_21190, partial [Spirochaetales bacterium]|nr:hypothetical protein [Spirochaetales bacterium]
MKTTDLAGEWTLSGDLLDEAIPGRLPGCQYQDLLAAGLMDDPFFGTNEGAALDWARGDYEYARDIVLSDDDLGEEHLLLRISGVDTVGEILMNDRLLGRTDNIHRTYELDIRPHARAGKNRIVIRLRSPMTYVEERQQSDPIPFSAMGTKGIAHIRKVQSHFGWDWGPVLPTMGVSGAVELVAYSGPRIDELRVTQHHRAGRVELALSAALSGTALPAHYRVEALLGEPGGASRKVALSTKGERATGTITVDNPRLWWCNGLGEQPLYDLCLRLSEGDTVVQELKKRIGLRTLELDTARDEWGRNFRFVINGVPIFAKGANWIPSDSFIGRTTPEDLRYLLRSARDTNMNMLRVWGGGYYGSDDFYDLCDELGLLVWQDFAFACSPYPLYDPEFRESVRREVVDNLRRLRHRPSLALWCGSNEIDMMAVLWKRHKKIHRATQEFFHDTLPRWVAEEDDVTPYWPGSPSSGINRPKPNALHEGDT